MTVTQVGPPEGVGFGSELEALGVSGPAVTAGVGQPYLIVEAPSPAHVAQMVPDMDALAALPEVYVFALEGGTATARFFAPQFGQVTRRA